MTPNQTATLLYGVLTLLLAALMALQSQSRLAMAMVIAASGLTYFFQASQEIGDVGIKVYIILMLLITALVITSVLVSLGA